MERHVKQGFKRKSIRRAFVIVGLYVLAVGRLIRWLKGLSFKKALGLSMGIVVLLSLSLFFGAIAAVSVNTSVNTSGSISTSRGLKLYSDSSCTVPLGNLSWGSISPGGSSDNTVYIKNINSTPLKLSLATSNWNPISANGPLALTWDKDGSTLMPGQSTVAKITLLVASDIINISTFEFKIVISGIS